MKTSKLVTLITAFALLTGMSWSSFASQEDKPGPALGETAKEPAEAPAEKNPDEVLFYRPNQSPYRVNLKLELPLIVVGGLVAGVPRVLLSESSGPWCGLDCDANNVNAFDRLTVNMVSQTYGDVSDYIMFASIPLPFIANLIDVAVSDPHDGWSGYGKDALVLFETMALTVYVNSLVSLIARRPRPYVYNDSVSDDFRSKGEATMSFYSGHTSVVFAAATAYSRLFMLRHPDSSFVIPVWLLAMGIASAEGTLRVVSGSHWRQR